MLITELAKEIHENAVAHGWWEDKRKAPEILALIHSEWSEALEEARADRPLVWYDIYDNGDDCGGGGRCGAHVDSGICHGRNGKCERNHKPEGVAVELIDGCIRILDYIGKLNTEVDDLDAEIKSIGFDDVSLEIEAFYSDKIADSVYDDLPELIAWLHLHTANCLTVSEECDAVLIVALFMPLMQAMGWVKKQGIDPLALLLEKHEYNKTRPYKHGKKF